jgi:hypothetical protein
MSVTHQMMEEHSSGGKLKHVEEIIVALKGVLHGQGAIERKESSPIKKLIL